MRVFVVAIGDARITTPRGVVRGLMLGARRHNNSGGWWRSVAGRPRCDVSGRWLWAVGYDGVGQEGEGSISEGKTLLLTSRGDCWYFGRAAGLVGWLVRCPGAVVDFDLFRGATMAPLNDYS